MCDRIKEDDDRMKTIKNNKCFEENKNLEICLKDHDRDFRKCKEYLEKLKVCMSNKNSN